MKSILNIAAASIIIVTFLISCGNDSQKHMENAKGNINESSKEIKEAAKDAREETIVIIQEEWNRFKTESDSLIVETQNQLDSLTLKIDKADKSQREKLIERQNELQQKLNIQKKKLNQQHLKLDNTAHQAKDSLVARTESFKKEFKRDLKQLKEAIKAFGESSE